MTLTTPCQLCARPLTLEIDETLFHPEKIKSAVVCDECALARRRKFKRIKAAARPAIPYRAAFPDP